MNEISGLKNSIRKYLPAATLQRILPYYHFLKRNIYSGNLNVLAELYGSDKWGWHSYTQYYMPIFLPLKNEKINLLEIGIGGYDIPDKGGESLRMWSTFFPNANIYGIDIYDKSRLDTKRIKTFKGSQSDTNFLSAVIKYTGKPDIIIDDGSHVPADQIASFNFLFQHLKQGGYYIVEDTSGSYSGAWGGSEDIAAPFTFLNYAKSLTDNVNFAFLLENPNFKNTPGVLRTEFESICFYKDLVIIKKA